MSPLQNNDYPNSDYLIRPAKNNECLAIAQLLFNRNESKLSWLLLIFSCICGVAFVLGTLVICAEFLLVTIVEHVRLQSINLKFIASAIVSISIFLVLPISYISNFALKIARCLQPRNNYLAINNHEIVGAVSLVEQDKKSYLRYLFVKPKYRQQGIGSNLLTTAIATTNKPIYTDYFTLDQMYWLNRFGFKQRSFSGIRYWLNKFGTMQQMILASGDRNTNNNYKSQATGKTAERYAIDRPSRQDLTGIYELTLGLQDTQDSFLPFGYKTVVRTSIFYCLTLLLQIVFILCGLIIYQFANFLWEKIFLANRWFALALLLCIPVLSLVYLAVLILLPALVTTKIITAHRSQFWVIKQHDKVIGYGRLSQLANYAVLHHVFVLPLFQTSATPELIQHLLKQTSSPVYACCSRRKAQQYYEHGLSKITCDRLPLELRLGAKISQIFGAVILSK